MDEKLDIIINMLNRIDERISILETKVNSGNANSNIIEVKSQTFKLDEKFIIDCLEETSVNGDIKIIKKCYFDNIPINLYPIRCKKNLEYWHENEWKSDSKYLAETLIQNLKSCYVSVNLFSNYQDNLDQFIKNQSYVLTELNSEKYKEKLLKSLRAFFS